jgi:hypothetical protein
MNPERDESWPALFGVGAKSLVENAKRLGLTWRLTLGTVTEVTSADSLQVRLDGDTVSITVISMLGTSAVGNRVYVITVPPAANYAVGQVNTLYPSQQIAITTRTSSVGTFTVETLLDSVTASLVSGKTYRVRYYVRLFSSVADGIARFRIREDSTSGTVLAITQLYTTVTINQSFPTYIEVLYTAVATGDKTFVATGIRQTGTGNLTAQAATDAPTYLYVEYVSG